MLIAAFEDSIRAFCVSIDRLDKHECSQESIAGSVALLLEKMTTHDMLMRTAAAVQCELAVGKTFREEYWKESTMQNKASTLLSIVQLAEEMIIDGEIPDTVIEATRKVLKSNA